MTLSWVLSGLLVAGGYGASVARLNSDRSRYAALTTKNAEWGPQGFPV